MNINNAGIQLIKTFEGCKLTAYQDQKGIWTVGFGCTGPTIKEGLTITQDEADKMLLDALGLVIRGLNGLIVVPITENQFNAMASLIYNVGLEYFKTSTLLRYVNNSDFVAAADQFLLWDHCAGKVDPGLLRRRQAERELFLTA
jgi:lysozyme